MRTDIPGTLEVPMRRDLAASPTIDNAYALLASSPHFRYGHHGLTIREDADGSLEIDGRVMSYFLKQAVQEAIRPLGVTIVNRVNVA
ncbi:hypothetical protein Poly24_26810 [Rosistilla carotiformis]|uniref:BON domain-containing protein n=1 Tax=Rosistilla carotiformis TaxID=2528017 RepID=A0A518JTV6_9BACT|nr:hypothetical protein [Rosistilla carotiformis]QDV68968.1 hypothetical protein Poly24_26810 [Rosistilla carotiformis]